MPDAPTNLQAEATGTTSIRLTWTAPDGPVSGYTIERKLGTTGDYVQAGSAGPGDTSFDDSGLTPNRPYIYRVRAGDQDGPGPASAEVCAVTKYGGGGSIKTDRGTYLPDGTDPPDSTKVPPLPLAGHSFFDEVFGTEILRVTDESDGQVIGVSYSYWPTFNADNTRMLVQMLDGTGRLCAFDAQAFRSGPRESIAPLPDGTPLNPEGAIWSATDPDKFFAPHGAALYSYDAATGEWTEIPLPGGCWPVADERLYQMSKSEDDNIFAFTRRDAATEDSVGYLVFRRDPPAILLNALAPRLDEVQIDKTGRFLLVKDDVPGPEAGDVTVRVIDLEARRVEDLVSGPPDYAPGHSDNGRGTVVGLEGYGNRLMIRELADPHKPKSLLEFGDDWSQAGHVSMRADDEGWAMLSMYFVKPIGNTPPSGVFRDELMLVATDTSGRVRRFAHHRSIFSCKQLVGRACDEWRSPADDGIECTKCQSQTQPRANISRDGRFVAFSSSWGTFFWPGESGRLDLFVAKLPDPAV